MNRRAAVGGRHDRSAAGERPCRSRGVRCMEAWPMSWLIRQSRKALAVVGVSAAAALVLPGEGRAQQNPAGQLGAPAAVDTPLRIPAVTFRAPQSAPQSAPANSLAPLSMHGALTAPLQPAAPAPRPTEPTSAVPGAILGFQE